MKSLQLEKISFKLVYYRFNMEELLTTKFFIPPNQPHHIKRPQLIEHLNQGLHRKLTLLSAPAGFGKSMLISEWIDNLKAREQKQEYKENIIAWISYEKTENDTSLFLAYLVGTLIKNKGISTTFGENILEVIYLPKPPFREILTAILNEIAAFPGKIILVIDDFHTIELKQIHETMIFLIEHLPPQFHVVIATRDDPPLPLARLRAQGQLTEIRAAELRFSSSQIAGFFNGIERLNLTQKEIALLEERSEGWIVGMQLAAASMRGMTDPASLREPLTGNNPFVLDYLITEVLDRQSEKMKLFLLQTSILSRFTSDLCNVLTEQNSSSEILMKLVQMNLFIVPLDDKGHWYRYHHLFADLLRVRFSIGNRNEIKPLQVKASIWFEENGFSEEAIEYSLQAKDYKRTVYLMEQYVNGIIKSGGYAIVWRWLNEIPEEIILSAPDLSILKAWQLFTGGFVIRAEDHLQAAEECLLHDGETEKTPVLIEKENGIRGRAMAIRAFLDTYRGDVFGIIKNAQLALTLLSPGDLVWRSLASMALGDAQGISGNMQKAYSSRLKALEESKTSGNIYLILLCSMKLAITLRMWGRLTSVQDICQKYFQQAESRGMSQMVVVGWLYSIWAEVLAETGHLKEALIKGRLAVELTEQSDDIAMIGWTRLCLSRILFIRGDLSGAEKIISEMEELFLDRTIPPYISGMISAWKCRILLAQNKIDEAKQWCLTRNFSIDDKLTQMNEGEYIVFARFLLDLKKNSDALKLLQRLLDITESAGLVSRMIDILILQVLVYDAENMKEKALSALKRVLTLAEDGGFFQVLVVEGAVMVRLLYKLVEMGNSSPYVQRLLSAFQKKEVEPVNQSISHEPQTSLIEPLSDREMDVLHLLADGLSRQDMAEKLFVSPHTVKSHLRSIYGKLGIHNQVQAVNRARSLGILEAGGTENV